jgi:hypothetical protein
VTEVRSQTIAMPIANDCDGVCVCGAGGGDGVLGESGTA